MSKPRLEFCTLIALLSNNCAQGSEAEAHCRYHRSRDNYTKASAGAGIVTPHVHILACEIKNSHSVDYDIVNHRSVIFS
jgi:hypothetical protein